MLVQTAPSVDMGIIQGSLSCWLKTTSLTASSQRTVGRSWRSRVIANNGKEALDLLVKEHFDCV